MIGNGVKPVKRDHRDFSATRTFGGFVHLTFPENYSCDNGGGFPDHNADGLPEGCTGFTQAELCRDEDMLEFLPRYTYDKTLLMEGSQEGEGCDIRDSLNSTILYGVLAKGETTDAE